jgi:hypothetical protein
MALQKRSGRRRSYKWSWTRQRERERRRRNGARHARLRAGPRSSRAGPRSSRAGPRSSRRPVLQLDDRGLVWRSPRHNGLCLHSFTGSEQIRTQVAFYVEQHNGVMPHSTFDGSTPDEVYFGGAEAGEKEAKRRRERAIAQRLAANRSRRCGVCPRASPDEHDRVAQRSLGRRKAKQSHEDCICVLELQNVRLRSRAA